MAAERSLFGDLLHAFAEWLGYMPRESIDERFTPKDTAEKDYLPRAALRSRFQPVPLRWWFNRFQSETVITRAWRAEDVKFCTLCPKCAARVVADEPGLRAVAVCVIRAPRAVADGEEAFYRKPDEPAK